MKPTSIIIVTPETRGTRLFRKKENYWWFYYYLGLVNQYMVTHNLSFLWKQEQMERLYKAFGNPKRTTRFENFLIKIGL